MNPITCSLTGIDRAVPLVDADKPCAAIGWQVDAYDLAINQLPLE